MDLSCEFKDSLTTFRFCCSCLQKTVFIRLKQTDTSLIFDTSYIRPTSWFFLTSTPFSVSSSSEESLSSELESCFSALLGVLLFTELSFLLASVSSSESLSSEELELSSFFVDLTSLLTGAPFFSFSSSLLSSSELDESSFFWDAALMAGAWIVVDCENNEI